MLCWPIRSSSSTRLRRSISTCCQHSHPLRERRAIPPSRGRTLRTRKERRTRRRMLHRPPRQWISDMAKYPTKGMGRNYRQPQFEIVWSLKPCQILFQHRHSPPRGVRLGQILFQRRLSSGFFFWRKNSWRGSYCNILLECTRDFTSSQRTACSVAEVSLCWFVHMMFMMFWLIVHVPGSRHLPCFPVVQQHPFFSYSIFLLDNFF